MLEVSTNNFTKYSSDLAVFTSLVTNCSYFTLFSRDVSRQAAYFLLKTSVGKLIKVIIHPDCRQMWNLPESNKYVRALYKLSLPTIATHQVIYVPKLLQPLTPDSLARKCLQRIERVDPTFLKTKKSNYTT